MARYDNSLQVAIEMRQGPCMWFSSLFFFLQAWMTWGLWGKPPSSPTLTLTLTGSSALHCHLLPPLTSFLDQRFFSPLGFDVFVWESCELKAIKQKTVVHMWQCFYSYITGKSSQFWYPGLWGDPWSDHKHPGQLCKKNESDARRTIHDLREQMELLFFPFFFSSPATRGIPPNSGLLPALSMSPQLLAWPVESELLWSQLAADSCSQAKQSIDPGCRFHTRVSGGRRWSLMCLCRVCGVKGRHGDKVMTSLCYFWCVCVCHH